MLNACTFALDVLFYVCKQKMYLFISTLEQNFLYCTGTCPWPVFKTYFVLLLCVISYKYLPFSFQWKLVLIKWSTKSSVIWAWRETRQTVIRSICSCQSCHKTSSLSGMSLLSSITNSSEKNTSLHFCLQMSK